MKETKVYLNTIEDLTQALSDGKTVFIKYTGQGDYINDNSQLKIVNGIIVQKLENGSIYLNPSDFSLKVYKFYIKEKEPLKIEVGKFYKTRDGRKVVCVNINFKSAVCCFSILNSENNFWTTLEGYFFAFEKEDKRDIVDYWEDK